MTTLSPAEQKVLADVRAHGWHVINVMPEKTSPGWAFSIGLFETLHRPEILIFGLRDSTMLPLFNQAAESMKEGKKYADGCLNHTLLPPSPCQLTPVTRKDFRCDSSAA